MALDQLTSNEKIRLTEFMDEGVSILQELKDRKESLKDLTKQVAEEIGCKPAALTTALNVRFAGNDEERREKMSDVDFILEVTNGR